jgi:cellulose synthase/poly-beta-1,6-N-acetylglucosamine synthase-like glycosyltransferase
VKLYSYSAERFTAAAGRRIGFAQVDAEYVLFVDGDCSLNPDWCLIGLRYLESRPNAAVVHGLRHEVYEGIPVHFCSNSPKPKEYSLGGNGLYRAAILEMVGGFNPFVVGAEDDELLGRILAAGYEVYRTDEVMFAHYTIPKDSMQGCWRRLRLQRGFGQVLRLSLAQGTWKFHARRLKRYLAVLAYLVLGAAMIVVGVAMGTARWPLLWVAGGVSVFVILVWRRASFRGAVAIVADWVSVAASLPFSFLARPRLPEEFNPRVQRIRTALDGQIVATQRTRMEEECD